MTHSTQISCLPTLTLGRASRALSTVLMASVCMIAGCSADAGDPVTSEPDEEALSRDGGLAADSPTEGAPADETGAEETGTEETGTEETARALPGGLRVKGCSVYSSAAAGSWTIPGGVFCFGLDGSAAPKGHGATYMVGEWTAPTASNWRIDFVAYDRNHKVQWSEKGPSHWTTNYVTGKRVRKDPKGWLPYGEACAELYQNGRRIDSACLSITP